ncbi:MAG TPA: DUF5606 domain-containing protein [Chitinophagaceae bacterium]|nr:DUF5606 domain-containing protein [Chitinophagaceae bacterium]
MEYSKIVAVTGMPGLFELVNSKSDGAIVRSLDDNSTKFASSRIHNFSHLESIEVYTTGDNVNLVEVFHAMEKAGGSLPDGKDAGILRKYFEKTYPELDFERVYSSDLKKMVKWFEILKNKNIEIKLTELPEEEEEVIDESIVAAKEVKEEKPAKKAAPKKAAEEKAAAPKAEKKATKTESAARSEKAAPKKKTATKKATEEKAAAPKKKSAPKKK